MYEIAVVGGSYAGLSAALQIARARRRVAVIDGGRRRNRFARASHGFLGQDGRDPGLIAAEAKAQLLRYPTVSWFDATVLDAGREAGGDFHLRLDDGPTIMARRLVLATGIKDVLPDLPGLAERWGDTVFHCPYCHGYELGGGPVGVLAASRLSLHHALMLPDWGPTTLFLNGVFEPDAEETAALAARKVAVERTPVVRLSGAEGVDAELADGRSIRLAGLAIMPRIRPSSPVAEQLGCTLEEGPAGPFVRTDDSKETSIPGVFACGDVARPMGNVALSVGDGAIAGARAHFSLLRAPA